MTLQSLLHKDASMTHFPLAVERGAVGSRVSNRYGFIDTAQLLEQFERHNYLVTQSNTLRPRKHDPRSVRHLVRMRHADQAVALHGVVPEIVLVNAHDGSSSLKLMAGLFRLVCSNGLIVQSASFAPTLIIRHSAGAMTAALAAANETLLAAVTVANRIPTFQQRMLTAQERITFAARANDLWSGRVRPEALLEMRRSEDGGDDLWTVFNRVQENLMVGGLVGATATGRRTRTHGIKALDNSVRVNRELWALAEEFAA